MAVRDPQERLAAIRDRADAHIAAIKKRNRIITSACTTLALCVAIGLGVYNAMSTPPTPPLEPTIDTTASSGVTAATSTTAVSTTAVTTTASSIDTTVITTQPSASEPVHVTVTTEPPVLSTVTTVMTTLPSRPTVSHTASTTRATPTVTVLPPSTTSVSKDTTTWPEVMATQPTTTTTDTNTDGEVNGNIQSPPHDGLTTTTANPFWQETTTTKAPTTTTTTYAPTTSPCDSVSVAVDSVQGVSVGDIITVEVTVSDYHYIVAGKLYIRYDPDALELQGEVQNEFGNILNGACALEVRCPSEGDIELLFSSSATEGSVEGGTVLRLTFQVLSGIRSGTSVICEIPAMISNCGQGDYDTPVTVIDGIITPADPSIYDWWM